MKILLAEDTLDLNKALCALFKHQNYEIDSALDGQEALDYIEVEAYDCIILDVMMPKKNGIEVLEAIRKKNIITPVLMLTAKSEIEDRVTGLDAGADDYLTKPFAIKELLARVRALTRRKTEYTAENLKYKDVKLNSSSFELSSENAVRLSIKEFELMQAFMLNPERSLSVKYLTEAVWNNAPEVTSNTVLLYISYLRRKLRAISSEISIEGAADTGFKLL